MCTPPSHAVIDWETTSLFAVAVPNDVVAVSVAIVVAITIVIIAAFAAATEQQYTMHNNLFIKSIFTMVIYLLFIWKNFSCKIKRKTQIISFIVLDLKICGLSVASIWCYKCAICVKYDINYVYKMYCFDRLLAFGDAFAQFSIEYFPMLFLNSFFNGMFRF